MTKTFSFRTFALFALALLVAASGYGQTAMGTTTLSAAVTTSQTSIRVASATGIVGASRPISSSEIGAPAGASFILLFVDKEAIAVNTISGTTAQVIRGWNGTLQTPHVSGAKVWVGPSYAYGNYDPSGACQSTTLPYLPRIVPSTGNIWDCTGATGQWTTFASFPGRLVVGSQITAAATITIHAPVTHITGTTTISTITTSALPGSGGCIILVPDATSYTTSTGGNVALATTLATGKMLTLCYDPATAKYYPSY